MRRREALCAAVQTALRAKGRPFMNYERAPNRRGTKTHAARFPHPPLRRQCRKRGPAALSGRVFCI